MVAQQSRLYPINKQIASVTIGSNTVSYPLSTANSVRAMVQTGEPYARYEFRFPPVTINFDGMAAEYTELPRPLLNPAVDVKASRSYRVSFEFLVAAPIQNPSPSALYDSVFRSIDNELRTLEQMANRPVPVRFENFDILMTGNSWYISEMSFNAVRYNTQGQITACQVTMSLINFQQQTSRFISLPKISYKAKPKKTAKDSTTEPKADDATLADLYRASEKARLLLVPRRKSSVTQAIPS